MVEQKAPPAGKEIEITEPFELHADRAGKIHIRIGAGQKKADMLDNKNKPVVFDPKKDVLVIKEGYKPETVDTGIHIDGTNRVDHRLPIRVTNETKNPLMMQSSFIGMKGDFLIPPRLSQLTGLSVGNGMITTKGPKIEEIKKESATAPAGTKLVTYISVTGETIKFGATPDARIDIVSPGAKRADFIAGRKQAHFTLDGKEDLKTVLKRKDALVDVVIDKAKFAFSQVNGRNAMITPVQAKRVPQFQELGLPTNVRYAFGEYKVPKKKADPEVGPFTPYPKKEKKMGDARLQADALKDMLVKLPVADVSVAAVPARTTAVKIPGVDIPDFT